MTIDPRTLLIGNAIVVALTLTNPMAAVAQAPAASAHHSNKADKPAAPATPEQARQARLVADTAKLFQLAQELKAEVDKSSKDTMSVSVIKKAAEVEELARDLKVRMKNQAPKTQ